MTTTCQSTYKRRRCARPAGHPGNHLSGEAVGAYMWHGPTDDDPPTLDFHPTEHTA